MAQLKPIPKKRALPLLLFVMFSAISSAPVSGGGGPENVFVVVNPRSWASMTVANHYCHSRRIPRGNVMYLDWKGLPTTITQASFTTNFLKPILNEINTRRLGSQIDCIAYSSDFPFRVQFDTINKNAKYNYASLTGMTYLAPLVLNKKPFTYGQNNWYFSHEGKSRAFSSQYMWDSKGNKVQTQGMRYIMSTLLAFTSGDGNSVDEALGYLRSSVWVDGTHPRGTIYYMKNSDVRSRTRDRKFPAAVQRLRALGVKAEIIEGTLPKNKPDVQGLMIGQARWSWASSKSTIRPGAICENLTSYGGILFPVKTQTLMTEFLRYGAAGTSGTITEPYAISNKFPAANIQVHYAEGSSLAESFYQSINGPYQILIMGDPLCSPWASIPIVQLAGLKQNEQVKGTITLSPSAYVAGGRKVRHFHLFMDGTRMATVAPGQSYAIDTLRLPDGHHELRVVAVEDTPIECQGRLIIPFVSDNRGHAVSCRLKNKETVTLDTPFSVEVSAPGASTVILLAGRRSLGSVTGDRGVITVDPMRLGLGPVQLQAIGVRSRVGLENSISAPLNIRVLSNPTIPARLSAPTIVSEEGVLITRDKDRKATSVLKTESGACLTQAGIGPKEPFRMTGYFLVPRSNVYQFLLNYAGDLQLSIDGIPLLEKTVQETVEVRYVPVDLEKGWHKFELSGAVTTTNFGIFFGGPGTKPLGKARFIHQRPRKRTL